MSHIVHCLNKLDAGTQEKTLEHRKRLSVASSTRRRQTLARYVSHRTLSEQARRWNTGKDYLLHQVQEDGRPWLDMSHIVHCLNKLDAGTQEKTICCIKYKKTADPG
ncbi:PAN2-PAN3 deadenylation complex subunit PAN3-like [Diaphorina citri]|uniref:PAN2-PAN3 deadenylation complex subunit PAN3-like n=1 Tax=Diaphorina citri TaxID=121845 RepID=A0A3Q0IQ34_DIACI|nr:PAN2-PAN3 deadenylation complex subunit PAN3-like [Diaphorina citri]